MTNVKVCRWCGKHLGNTKFMSKHRWKYDEAYIYVYQCKKCGQRTAIDYEVGKAVRWYF